MPPRQSGLAVARLRQCRISWLFTLIASRGTTASSSSASAEACRSVPATSTIGAMERSTSRTAFESAWTPSISRCISAASSWTRRILVSGPGSTDAAERDPNRKRRFLVREPTPQQAGCIRRLPAAGTTDARGSARSISFGSSWKSSGRDVLFLILSQFDPDQTLIVIAAMGCAQQYSCLCARSTWPAWEVHGPHTAKSILRTELRRRR